MEANEVTDKENLKSYYVMYSTIAPSGIHDMSHKKQKIDAKSEGAAIENIKLIAQQDGGRSVRIDSIKEINLPEKLEKKKKRSVLGWLAVGLFILASLAKLIDKFLWIVIPEERGAN
mgnify:FL=1